jgi:PIN domain nuclease of toxin-antitoxin system
LKTLSVTLGMYTYRRFLLCKRFGGKTKAPLAALERLRSALTDPSSGMLIAPVDASVADALPNIPRDVVPDMPDRIIAATALHLGFPLVTRDRRLQAAGIQTIW